LPKEFGDFQTPPALVQDILHYLTANNQIWNRVIEPACGCGNFITGLLNLPHPPREIQGIEIQDSYVKIARKLAENSSTSHITITKSIVFDLDFKLDFQWQGNGKLLVIGNPPWVTNSQLGTDDSTNLPKKSNLKGLRGIDALTGSSNFDISEYIWIKLLRELADQQPTIALLCKTSVARNVLQFAYANQLPIKKSTIRLIDAKKWFNAAVSACLFCVEMGTKKGNYQAEIYRDFSEVEPISRIGIIQGKLISDMDSYQKSQVIEGICPLTWRQGIKHDAASVMELTSDSQGFMKNKLGETVNIEEEYIYPLLKSSDLFNQEIINPQKWAIITQKNLKEDTNNLEKIAPQLWTYLITYKTMFDKRKSSIYKNRSPFAMFGIGDYTFSLYKVAISGLHKIPKFRLVSPVNNRPVMLDDTCYFLPCYSLEQAILITTLLNHSLCLEFIYSRFFSDAKRPITKKLLQCIDLTALLRNVDQQLVLSQIDLQFEHFSKISECEKLTLSSSLEKLLLPHLNDTLLFP
jgi:hypothetical protein